MARFPYTEIDYAYSDPGSFAVLAASDLGLALWEFLTRPDIVRSLIVAAMLGQAPVSAISDELLAEFGVPGSSLPPRERLANGLRNRFPQGTPVSLDRVKQMIGHMIKLILAAHGYKVRSTSSSARDPEGIFTTSARYEKE